MGIKDAFNTGKKYLEEKNAWEKEKADYKKRIAELENQVELLNRTNKTLRGGTDAEQGWANVVEIFQRFTQRVATIDAAAKNKKGEDSPIKKRSLYLSLVITELMIPLYNLMGETQKADELKQLDIRYKDDMTQLYLLRHFRVLLNKYNGINNTEQVKDAVTDFGRGLVENKTVNTLVKACESDLKKIESFSTVIDALKKIYDLYHEEFYDLKCNFNPARWIEMVVTMGNIMDGLTDHVIGGRGIEYCYPLYDLMQDFKGKDVFEFRFQDYAKSTTYSDNVYKTLTDISNMLKEKYGRGLDFGKIRAVTDNYNVTGSTYESMHADPDIATQVAMQKQYGD